MSEKLDLDELQQARHVAIINSIVSKPLRYQCHKEGSMSYGESEFDDVTQDVVRPLLSRLRALERVAAAVVAERKAKDAVALANAYCRRAQSEGRGGEDETRDAIRAENRSDACVKATDAALKEAGL